MTLVVDASALVFATTEDSLSAAQLRRRLAEDECHAPHLIDAELGNVLRRKTLRGEIEPGLAATLLRLAPGLIDRRHGHLRPLALSAWSQRANLTFYDALYVALATALVSPLLTTDARIAAAPGLPCTVDVVG